MPGEGRMIGTAKENVEEMYNQLTLGRAFHLRCMTAIIYLTSW